MYTLLDQVTMIVYFTILGMFVTIMFETINFFFEQKKIVNYLIQIVFWILMILICLKSVDKISDGQLPIYTILFFVVGYFLYQKLLKKQYLKTLLKIKEHRRKVLIIILPIEFMAVLKKWSKQRKLRRKKHEKNVADTTTISSKPKFIWLRKRR